MRAIRSTSVALVSVVCASLTAGLAGSAHATTQPRSLRAAMASLRAIAHDDDDDDCGLVLARLTGLDSLMAQITAESQVQKPDMAKLSMLQSTMDQQGADLMVLLQQAAAQGGTVQVTAAQGQAVSVPAQVQMSVPAQVQMSVPAGVQTSSSLALTQMSVPSRVQTSSSLALTQMSAPARVQMSDAVAAQLQASVPSRVQLTVPLGAHLNVRLRHKTADALTGIEAQLQKLVGDVADLVKAVAAADSAMIKTQVGKVISDLEALLGSVEHLLIGLLPSSAPATAGARPWAHAPGNGAAKPWAHAAPEKAGGQAASAHPARPAAAAVVPPANPGHPAMAAPAKPAGPAASRTS